MTPERQLNIATHLMIAGLVPLLLGSMFGLAIVNSDDWASGKAGQGEALMIFMVMLAAYAFAICVSGVAMLWAFIAHRRYAPYRSRRASITSRIVLILLAAPIFYMTVIQ